jgi:hypothetical protein
MKQLPFPGRRREGEYLPGIGNFVPGAGGLRREQKVPAWKAGTLPLSYSRKAKLQVDFTPYWNGKASCR